MGLQHISACLRLSRVAFHLAWGSVQTGLVFPFASIERRDQMKQGWSRKLLHLLNIEIDSADPALNDLNGGLLVANHVSFVDIFVINALLPSGFVAKNDVATWPLIGWLSRRNETVFIERGSRKAAHQTQIHMVEILRQGRRLTLFPEGTTTLGTSVLPFHGALFQSAVDAGVAVHALVIRYVDANGTTSTAPAYIGETSLFECLLKTLGSGGVRARLQLAESFLPPLAERRHLAHRSHQAIAANLQKFACQDAS
jgi:1-acyl-sn-glycerol-3-phosphate acyltransferase